MRPYLTLDNKIDGAVLMLVDVDTLKRAEAEAKAMRDYAEAIVRTARDPLIVLRGETSRRHAHSRGCLESG